MNRKCLALLRLVGVYLAFSSYGQVQDIIVSWALVRLIAAFLSYDMDNDQPQFQLWKEKDEI